MTFASERLTMFFSRQQLEEIEDKSLAPYGMRSKDSKGRAYLDNEPEYRTAFQRDRDRIIHTTAFRRLEYKTQVFINYEGDYFRTRLTHTLEVAQIGRTIARALGANEDLTETLCLSHDLGHPPFGHAGEEALAELMKDNGGFDHNKQTLRIVTELEQRYVEFPGLNLTWEVREGITKHKSDADVSEMHEYSPELRPLIEAQIANAADDLAYSAHDLDDGLRSGILTPNSLETTKVWKLLIEKSEWHSSKLNDVARHEIIRNLIGLQVSDLIQATNIKIQKVGAKSILDIQKHSQDVLTFSEEIYQTNRELREFLYNNLYHHYRVERMHAKAKQIIDGIFHAYESNHSVHPPSLRSNVSKFGIYRAICDYIAGMTDRYAIEEHSKLVDPYTLT
jgi:dGTPase